MTVRWKPRFRMRLAGTLLAGFLALLLWVLIAATVRLFWLI